MLTHAFQRNYDIAILAAGDRDFVPLVEEVKRYGAVVWGCYFDGHGLAKELKRTFDRYSELISSYETETQLIPAWKRDLIAVAKPDRKSEGTA